MYNYENHLKGKTKDEIIKDITNYFGNVLFYFKTTKGLPIEYMQERFKELDKMNFAEQILFYLNYRNNNLDLEKYIK